MMRTSWLDEIAFGTETRVFDTTRGGGARHGARIRVDGGPIGVEHSNGDENAKEQMKHAPARIETEPRAHDKEDDRERRHHNEQRDSARHTTTFGLLLGAQPAASVVGARAKARPLFAALAAALVARHVLAQRTTVL